MGTRVRQALAWVDQLIRSDASERRAIRKEVLDGVREFSTRGEGSSDTKAGKALARSLGKMKFIGFVPNISYVKEQGSSDEMKAVWVHAFGTETLLYKHPSLPILILVNPSIRHDKSVLAEMKLNSSQAFDLLGISG